MALGLCVFFSHFPRCRAPIPPLCLATVTTSPPHHIILLNRRQKDSGKKVAMIRRPSNAYA